MMRIHIHPIFLSFALVTLTTILPPPAATSFSCPPPRPPPQPPNLTPEAFHRCLNRRPESSAGISFSTIYAPTINRTSFSSLLNSTAQNLRCLSPSIPKPFLIFTPLHESHVSPAVTCARDLRLDLRVRSGGHDYECLSYISLLSHRPPFVLLDLQHLRHVSVDVATRTAWVQSGATVGELYYHVAEASRGTLAFPAGLYGSVGIGGHITVFLGKRDELLRVMRRSFPELGLDESECAEMTWIESVVFTGGYPNGTKPEYLLTGKPAFVNAFKAKSDFPRGNVPVEGLEQLVDFHRQGFSLLTIWNPFGGVMASAGEEDTPYPHRKVQGMIQYVVSWSDAESLETEAKNMEFMRRVYGTMGRYIPSGGRAREAYVNYKDLDIGRSSTNCDDSNCSCPYLWGPKYYLSNFDRLIRVKAEVDPCNFFRFEQSIPVSMSSERQCLKLI
ncbi:FAD-binding Berberine family protein [Striga hermonthica]|uniref:FAD-binding Berberine family protein n=1 Tax=Striga hermonthica TaxID=68872 RepID=A0A9N7N8N2_STRHE|nr:FAD-binding Berberine family protein [Striga hermonthica]